MSESQRIKSFDPPKAPQTSKTTEKVGERVGEEWPPILTKKWLANFYGFVSPKGAIAYRQFRKHVLTKELLERAGISPEIAYSPKTRMFSAIESMNIKKILAPAFVAFFATASMAQQTKTTFSPTQNISIGKGSFARDTFAFDTIPGVVIYQDSMIRMVAGESQGSYRYQNVSSTLVLDAWLIRKYRYLVKAENGGLEPFDLTQSFHFPSGALIDERRILLFKASPKPSPKK